MFPPGLCEHVVGMRLIVHIIALILGDFFFSIRGCDHETCSRDLALFKHRDTVIQEALGSIVKAQYNALVRQFQLAVDIFPHLLPGRIIIIF